MAVRAGRIISRAREITECAFFYSALPFSHRSTLFVDRRVRCACHALDQALSLSLAVHRESASSPEDLPAQGVPLSAPHPTRRATDSRGWQSDSDG
jgi:hypothetical protein